VQKNWLIYDNSTIEGSYNWREISLGPLQRICMVVPPGECLRVKADTVLFAGKTMWSISEHVRGVREQAIYKLTVMGKSQIKSQSEIIIIWRKGLNHYAKSQIKSHEIKSKLLEPKSQIKSNHDVNQMTTVPDSIIYVRNVINVHLAWLSMSLQRLGMVLLLKLTV